MDTCLNRSKTARSLQLFDLQNSSRTRTATLLLEAIIGTNILANKQEQLRTIHQSKERTLKERSKR